MSSEADDQTSSTLPSGDMRISVPLAAPAGAANSYPPIRFRPALDFPAKAIPQAMEMLREECRRRRRTTVRRGELSPQAANVTM